MPVALFGQDTQEEQARAARMVEEVIATLGVDPATVRSNLLGGRYAWSLIRGSAAMGIFLCAPKAHEDTC